MHPTLPEFPLAKTPSLYVVATPLGNLHDMGLRALAVLGAVNAIAAEDTRHSQRLLEAFGIKTRLVALHEHNEQVAVGQVIKMLEAGQHVALITDAGTPAVSDPGAKAVARVQEAGFPVVPVPGACAAIAALSASGLADGHFHFHGFLPTKSTARRAAPRMLSPPSVPDGPRRTRARKSPSPPTVARPIPAWASRSVSPGCSVCFSASSSASRSC